MRYIRLSQGKIATVDDHRYNELIAYSWHARQSKRTGLWYAFTNIKLPDGKWTVTGMHRMILGLKPGDPREADHVRVKRTLDNRELNLRIANRAQQQHNKRKPRNNTSGFKGVIFNKEKGLWRARIGVNGVRMFLGDFRRKREAAKAYKIAAMQHFGDFARAA